MFVVILFIELLRLHVMKLHNLLHVKCIILLNVVFLANYVSTKCIHWEKKKKPSFDIEIVVNDNYMVLFYNQTISFGIEIVVNDNMVLFTIRLI